MREKILLLILIIMYVIFIIYVLAVSIPHNNNYYNYIYL